MLTGDTITDGHIRKLKRMMLAHPNKTAFHHEALRACSIALTDHRAMAFQMEGVREGVERARARCAEILNTINKKNCP